MSFLDNVICPVSNVKINSYVSRLTVFINAVLITMYVFTHIPYFIIVVAVDYGIRATWNPKYSPLRWLAEQIARAISLPEKWSDQAPKLFASRLGFGFSLTSALLIPVGLMPSLVTAAILMVFAYLDSVLDFCVGCLTYTYLVLPFYQWRGVR